MQYRIVKNGIPISQFFDSLDAVSTAIQQVGLAYVGRDINGDNHLIYAENVRIELSF